MLVIVPRVDRCSEEVVSSSDGVNVPGHVQVEVLWSLLPYYQRFRIYALPQRTWTIQGLAPGFLLGFPQIRS